MTEPKYVSGPFQPKYVWAVLAGIAWLLVVLGLPMATWFAVVSSFAALDHIVNE